MRFFRLNKNVHFNQELTFLIGLFFAFNFTPALYAATYYVDATNGNNISTGLTPQSPWKSIAKVNASSFVPGDSVLFKRGQVWREQLNVPSSGSYGNPITFGAYGEGGLPVINAADLQPSGVWKADDPPTHWWTTYKNNSATVRIKRETYFPVADKGSLVAKTYYIDTAAGKLYVYSSTDLNFLETEISARQYGIWGGAKQYIVIQDIVACNASYGGIRFYGNQANGYNIVDRVTVFNNRVMGVVFDGGQHHNTVRNSEAYENGNGFVANGDADYTTISNCVSYNNRNNSISPITDGDGFGVYQSNNCILEHNITHDNQGDGIDIELGGGAHGIDVRYNLSYRNGYGSEGYGFNGPTASGDPADNRFYYNIAYNNNKSRACSNYTIYGPAVVYNNTSYCDGTTATNQAFTAVTGNIVFKNNISYVAGGATMQIAIKRFSGATITSDNNCWFNASGGEIAIDNATKRSFAEWQGLGYDKNSIKADPKFTKPSNGEFSLQPGSPCIDAGMDLGLTTDYKGLKVPRGRAPDIGALEYQPLSDLQPPVGLRMILQ